MTGVAIGPIRPQESIPHGGFLGRFTLGRVEGPRVSGRRGGRLISDVVGE